MKKYCIFHIFAILIAIGVATKEIEARVPLEYVTHGITIGNDQFSFDSTKKPWHSSRFSCLRKKGEFAVIQSDTVMETISHHLMESIYKNRSFWLGCTKPDRANEFSCLTPTNRMDYTNWGPGQPAKGEKNRCVMLVPNKKENRYLMSAEVCSRESYYLCMEKKPHRL